MIGCVLTAILIKFRIGLRPYEPPTDRPDTSAMEEGVLGSNGDDVHQTAHTHTHTHILSPLTSPPSLP